MDIATMSAARLTHPKNVSAALRDEHPSDYAVVLRAIEFPRVKGGKPFNIDTPWFEQLLREIGQTKGARLHTKH